MGGGQSQGSPSSSITSLVSHTCISAQHQVEADHVMWRCCGKTEMGGESPVAAEVLVCVVLTLYDSRGCRVSKAGCASRLWGVQVSAGVQVPRSPLPAGRQQHLLDIRPWHSEGLGHRGRPFTLPGGPRASLL